ncbi:SDR family NAD(P)-dependent oxidoreductase [Kribbella sp. NPDC056951]|uniref:SDR family NAD(P)-dependent oxidoreductase n=1 Tax=Kribbella sp. NPDC056951 TaxID=3345978 RepID=UPI00363CD38E
MSPTIAVFGAGSGLGAAVARRFGTAGYAVALVARRKEPLDALAAELAQDGVEAAAFAADLSDSAQLPDLIAAITGRFGRIDVIEYAPVGETLPFSPATDLTAAGLRPFAELYLYTPIELVKAVLPQWRATGSGAILLGQGATAIQSPPGMSGVGPVMSAARHWIHTLNAELAGTGIYAGTLTIATGIRNSRTYEDMVAASPDFASAPSVDPADLAELYWEMLSTRDHPERIHPPQDEWPDLLTGGSESAG